MTESAHPTPDSNITTREKTRDTPSSDRRVIRLAFAGFGIAALMLLIPLPFEGRQASAIGDLAHAPLFGSITIAVLFLWNRFAPLNSFGRHWFGRIVLVALCVFILGILVELAQMVTGRSPARHDVVANGLGIFAASLVCIAWLNRKYRRHGRTLTRLMLASAIAVLVAAWWVPMYLLYDIVRVQTAYPTISSFESNWEPTRWYLDDSSISFIDKNAGQEPSTEQHVTDGTRAMRWHFDDQEHPAITLIELPGDWTTAESFELDVTLDPSFVGEATLFVKVIDQDHADYHKDVSRKEFKLVPGETRHLKVDRDEIVNGPDSRKLDLSRIKHVSLMCYRPGQSSWIDVDFMRVRLRP